MEGTSSIIGAVEHAAFRLCFDLSHVVPSARVLGDVRSQQTPFSGNYEVVVFERVAITGYFFNDQDDLKRSDFR
jgi:hypothetical protein